MFKINTTLIPKGKRGNRTSLNLFVIFVKIWLHFFAALFILISIAVYASKGDELSKENALVGGASGDYHFAFAFSIIGMLAALGAVAVMMIEVVSNRVSK